MDNSADAQRRRKLFVLASELGMTRDDRLGLTEMLLMRDVGSWNELTEEDILRLLDAFTGFFLISQLTAQA